MRCDDVKHMPVNRTDVIPIMKRALSLLVIVIFLLDISPFIYNTHFEVIRLFSISGGQISETSDYLTDELKT